MTNKTFVVSDTWFNRPFGEHSNMSVSDYNQTIISNWNNKVESDDVIYVLGGFGVGDVYDIVFQLHGHIIFLDNYYNDDDRKVMESLKDNISKSISKDLRDRVTFDRRQIVILSELDSVLSYFPLVDWFGKDSGTYCFHGMNDESELSDHDISCCCCLSGLDVVSIDDMKFMVGFAENNRKFI